MNAFMVKIRHTHTRAGKGDTEEHDILAGNRYKGAHISKEVRQLDTGVQKSMKYQFMISFVCLADFWV